MRCKFYNIYLFLFLSFFFTSCGALSYHVDSVNKWSELIEKTRHEYEGKYIAKPKEKLIEDFGEPRARKNNEYVRGQFCDEQWYYNLSGGSFKEWNSQPGKAVWFCVENDVVKAIDVF